MVLPIIVATAAGAGIGALIGGEKKKETEIEITKKSDYQYSPTTTTTTSNSTINAPIDSRTFNFILDSPYATTSTKKDINSAPSLPNTVSPIIQPSPTLGGISDREAEIDGGGLSQILILAGLGVGGYATFTYFNRKKKKKGEKK